MKKTVILKDVLSVTLTEARQSVRNLTDKQIEALVTKLSKLNGIVTEESNIRFANKLVAEEELDNTIEDSVDNDLENTEQD